VPASPWGEAGAGGAEAGRDRKFDFAIGALGDLVDVLERTAVIARPEMDPFQQPSAFEPLTVVASVAYGDDSVRGGGLGLMISCRRQPGIVGRRT
jgi:hypothetical protein